MLDDVLSLRERDDLVAYLWALSRADLEAQLATYRREHEKARAALEQAREDEASTRAHVFAASLILQQRGFGSPGEDGGKNG